MGSCDEIPTEHFIICIMKRRLINLHLIFLSLKHTSQTLKSDYIILFMKGF